MKIELSTIKNKKFEVNISHFKQEKPRGILIVFPGAGYSCMGPCLYYPSNALYKKGFEILNIEYDFRRKPLEADSETYYKEFFDFIEEQLKQLDLPQKKYILSKSIGTRILASGNCEGFEKIVWLTPAIKDQFVIESIMKVCDKSLVVIGDRDPLYDLEKIQALETKGIKSIVIEGADHGLDIDNDLNKSLDELKVITACIEDFIAN